LWRSWDKLFFGLTLLGLVFAYGYGVGAKRWWPHAYVSPLVITADDLVNEVRNELRSESPYRIATDRTVGVVTHDEALASPGMTLTTDYRDGRFGAHLVDMAGNTVHSWDVSLAKIHGGEPPPHLDKLPSDEEFNIQGSLLLPNGDLLLNLFKTGTVRLDRCSNVVWLLRRPTHHAISQTPDGNFLIVTDFDPVSEIRPDRSRVGPGERGFYWDNGILLVSPEGKVLREI
jgi:hypothetical protein